MIEKAIFITGVAAGESLPDGYDRLYCGHEFCRWLLPSRRQVGEARRAAAARGMAFTLVTPVVNEEGLSRVMKLIEELSPEEGDEVVVNDVGLLDLLAGEKWKWAVVAGRLLSRQRRGAGWRGPLPPAAGDARTLRGSALDSPHLVEWYRDRYGVRRFEIDNLIQGVEVDPLPGDVSLSVYHPYLFLTATTLCPWTFDGRRWQSGEGCPSCGGEILELEPEEGGRKIIAAGNVQYLENDSPEIYAGPAVDRWVRQVGVNHKGVRR